MALYWLPLGAGGHFVRLVGRLYSPRTALFHSALEVEGHVIEMAPVWNEKALDRGVVVEGPVGLRVLGRSRAFRYEVRRWRDGRIPDVAEAVDSPRPVRADPRVVLDLVPSVPPLVWGRDERRTGEMWNSNSVISWLLTRAGVDAAQIRPPEGGRAPGWAAGIAVARHD